MVKTGLWVSNRHAQASQDLNCADDRYLDPPSHVNGVKNLHKTSAVVTTAF